jgi:uncharacterized protein YdeI (YjbR/CyaY-like superfamily)
MCVSWINSAKREETKENRLRKAIDLLKAGKELELKSQGEVHGR